ncbi:MAG TPA: hypothetical protein P5055_03245, partial [Candidatus Paceibacterota bacterium]|nr:hypothetical protein [Candidatus Paceibacterota bacterium]
DGSRSSSLDQAVEIQARIATALGPIPFLLALNKADLAAEWEIPESRIDALKSREWMVRRTSAKEGWGVNEIFQNLARRILGRSNSGAEHPSSFHE